MQHCGPGVPSPSARCLGSPTAPHLQPISPEKGLARRPCQISQLCTAHWQSVSIDGVCTPGLSAKWPSRPSGAAWATTASGGPCWIRGCGRRRQSVQAPSSKLELKGPSPAPKETLDVHSPNSSWFSQRHQLVLCCLHLES